MEMLAVLQLKEMVGRHQSAEPCAPTCLRDRGTKVAPGCRVLASSTSGAWSTRPVAAQRSRRRVVFGPTSRSPTSRRIGGGTLCPIARSRRAFKGNARAPRRTGWGGGRRRRGLGLETGGTLLRLRDRRARGSDSYFDDEAENLTALLSAGGGAREDEKLDGGLGPRRLHLASRPGPLSIRNCARTAHSTIIKGCQVSSPTRTFPQVKRTSTSLA